MKVPNLGRIFDGILLPGERLGGPIYAVKAVSGYSRYFVGRDSESLACVLISVSDLAGRSHPPIRLESLDVQFDLRCNLTEVDQPMREGMFTVIRFRDQNRETVRYFFSVLETIIRMLGNEPTREQISVVINRLTAIFQQLRRPSGRSLNGLFGELFLIHRSRNPVRSLLAWRRDDGARFDFSDGDVRLDVKATGSRNRRHMFSYEQCNLPLEAVGVVASLQVERVASGMKIDSLIDEIKARVSGHFDLILKLQETVCATLGVGLKEGLEAYFDMRLAESSLRFFWLSDIPAIRQRLPVGVSEVHFCSDLSILSAISIEALVSRDPVFVDLLLRVDDEI